MPADTATRHVQMGVWLRVRNAENFDGVDAEHTSANWLASAMFTSL